MPFVLNQANFAVSLCCIGCTRPYSGMLLRQQKEDCLFRAEQGVSKAKYPYRDSVFQSLKHAIDFAAPTANTQVKDGNGN